MPNTHYVRLLIDGVLAAHRVTLSGAGDRYSIVRLSDGTDTMVPTAMIRKSAAGAMRAPSA